MSAGQPGPVAADAEAPDAGAAGHAAAPGSGAAFAESARAGLIVALQTHDALVCVCHLCRRGLRL